MSDAIWSEKRLRLATDAAGVALWSWNVDSDQIAMDERAFEIWSLPYRDQITFEELSACILPSDLDKVREAFNSTRDLSGAYEIDFRILHGDEVRWITARGRGDDEGIVGRIMFGVFLDITVRKTAEEACELIAGEMQHRIKNLFSLASALNAFAARATESKDEMASDFTRRLAALAAAHDLIKPPSGGAKGAARLDKLLSVLLKAYACDCSSAPSISIVAPEILVGDTVVNSVAMIVHELATNSTKYGALSVVGGRLDLAVIDAADDVEIIWTEAGGPRQVAPVRQEGFGSLLTEKILKQIKGSIHRTWVDDGVIVKIRINKARLGA